MFFVMAHFGSGDHMTAGLQPHRFLGEGTGVQFTFRKQVHVCVLSSFCTLVDFLFSWVLLSELCVY